MQVQHFIRPENNNGKLKIAYLARHHILKGLYDLPLINQILLENNVEVDWLVMGDGGERENFKQQTEDIKNFVFYIAKNNEDVIQSLKDCDLFILPSRKDGLPVALLEAMSVGCVPIISNFSEGIKQVVTEDIGYVVNVADNKGFAECIINLHENRAELKVKSANSMSSIATNYDIKNKAKQYFNLYEDYAKYKKTINSQIVTRNFKKIYYFVISKISNPKLIIYKRKLSDTFNQFRSR